MLLLDDILLFPARGILWCFRQIQQAAEEAEGEEEDSIRRQLIELYMQLETGRLSEPEFAAGEKTLLDRLERAGSRGGRVLPE